jgi:hypothetical protein
MKRQERDEENSLQERGGTTEENRGCTTVYALCLSLVTLPIGSNLPDDYVSYEKTVEIATVPK